MRCWGGRPEPWHGARGPGQKILSPRRRTKVVRRLAAPVLCPAVPPLLTSTAAGIDAPARPAASPGAAATGFAAAAWTAAAAVGIAEAGPAALRTARAARTAWATHARHAGAALTRAAAGATLRIAPLAARVIEEAPLVVVGGAVIDADRRVLALAGDHHDAAAAPHPSGGLTAAQTGAGATAPLTGTRATLRSAAAAAGRPALRTRLVLSGGERQELPVFGHRILVLLAQVAPLHQGVDARRVLAAVPRGVQVNRARVLLAAKRQFGFLLALHLLPPHGEQRRHGDRHDRHADQHCRHGVATLSGLTL
jgi:hypothetical protein